MLTASVSHEILAPLNANIDITELLLEKITKEEQRHMLKMIITSSRLVMCHANDLMDYNILEHGVLIPYLEVCSLEKTILEVLDIAHLDSASNNRLFYDLTRIKNLEIKFDRRRLQQVLLNMLSNAIKFTKNGTIKIEINIVRSLSNKSEKFIEMSVKDDGIGISDQDLPQIFTPFFRSNEANCRLMN